MFKVVFYSTDNHGESEIDEVNISNQEAIDTLRSLARLLQSLP